MEKLLKDLKEQIHYDPFSGHFFWLPHTHAFKMAKTQNRLINGLALMRTKGNHGYFYTRVGGKSFLLHRLAWLIMNGSFPQKWKQIDHANGDPTDNRFCNLRLATRSQNQMNRGPDRTRSNRGKYKGVWWHKRRSLWRVAIRANGKVTHLGFFKTQEEAARAYDAMAKEHHGEFARFNFPDESIDH